LPEILPLNLKGSLFHFLLGQKEIVKFKTQAKHVATESGEFADAGSIPAASTIKIRAVLIFIRIDIDS
jgi:hypothetical protein